MRIEQGLFDGQVLQRNQKNRGGAALRGTCDGSGDLEARVLKGKKVLPRWNWRNAGKARNRVFKARIDDLPCGGPYAVELRIRKGEEVLESLLVKSVFVGDVWFMAGQSNMQGIGNMEDAPAPHPLVRCFYMRDAWDIARDPLHFLTEAVDTVHTGGVQVEAAELARQRALLQKGVGVGVFFGKEMVRRSGVPQGLVACGHGGTSMAQWAPALKGQGGNSLYGAMLRRFQKLGQPIAGMLWYQGCSDAGVPAGYTPNMIELVAAVRKDFRQANLPWVVVQIGRVLGEGWAPGLWNSIQDQQRLLVEKIRNLEVVPAGDLELDDMIHIGSKGFPLLADRMARMADRLALGNQREAGSIRVKSVRPIIRKTHLGRVYHAVEVVLANAVGGLRSAGRPTGFSAVLGDGKSTNPFIKIELEKDRAILETMVPAVAVECMNLHYGFGSDPYFNITDARGMAVPIFGPVPVGLRRGTAFITRWQVRLAAPGTTVRTMDYPADAERTEGWGAAFHNALPDCPGMIMPAQLNEPRTGIYIFRATVRSVQAMQVKLALGADSPCKVWMNGQVAMAEPTATNPCIPDQYEKTVALQAGENSLVTAFDSRNGQGWGFSLRFTPKPPMKVIEEGLITI